MNLFKKKFKVRVCHFAECKYTVEYTHYRFIPIWYRLNFWFCFNIHPSKTHCWSVSLFSVKKAEKLANQLKSINDVIEYYKPEEEKRKNFLEKEKEYWIKNAPYSVKKF